MIEPREQIDECRQRLHNLRGELACETLLRLAALEMSVLDRRLRTCADHELRQLQGQVQVWEKLQKYIHDVPHVAKNLT